MVDKPDYNALIDAQTWEFIRETERWFPDTAPDEPIADQRRRYDLMCDAFRSSRPPDVRVADLNADGVAIRVCSVSSGTTGPSVIYAHGGSLMMGGLDSHDDVCAEICAATRMQVINVDYRLLPEATLSDAQTDMQVALDWARASGAGPFVCVGDSAGGYLIAHMVYQNRMQNDIAGQVLIYPGLTAGCDGGSMDVHAFAPLLKAADICSYRQKLRDTNAGGENTRADLTRALGLADLPQTLTISAECDPMADDARLYADNINIAGGQAIWVQDAGLVHGHLRARHRVDRAGQSFGRILRGISVMATGTRLTAGMLWQ